MADQTLFAYGSLCEESTQKELLGRTLASTADTLNGFKRNFGILPPYAVAVPDPHESIGGEVFQVTEDELDILDEYEGTMYQRVKVVLASGQEAWVYVLNEAQI